jgi:hypothetical protein
VNLKRSEAAVGDLSVLVRLSKLPSKDQLAEKMDEVVTDAKVAGKGLHKLAARVGAAVGSIEAMDEYALRTLERLASSNSMGLTVANLLRKAVFLPETVAPTRNALVVIFAEAAAHMQKKLLDLIIQAEHTEGTLDRLEGHLKVVNEVAQRDIRDVEIDKDNLPGLVKLWTKLGGHNDRYKEFTSHLDLLGDIGVYRNQARDRVHQTIEQLQKLVAELEVLRSDVAKPALVKDETIPLEMHLQSIRNGVKNLAAFRRKAIEQEQESSRIIAYLSDATAIES